MLRIFRPRHIMWKYWMFWPEKPLWRGRREIMFGDFSRGAIEKRREWINFRICGLSYDHNEAVSRKKMVIPVFVKQLQDGNNELKSFNNRKMSETESGVKSIEQKNSPIFHVAPLQDADHCYLFLQYEYLIGYLWGFILLNPPGPASEWMPTIIMSLTINFNALCEKKCN